jgi:predicted dehydrogenase
MLKIGLIGIGGYGSQHLDSIRRLQNKGLCRLQAVCNRSPGKNSGAEREAIEQGARIYRSYEDMLAEQRGNIDLISICTAIAQHAAMSLAALEMGYHVICEKPAAGTLAEALSMRARQRASKKMLVIAYQNVYSRSIQHIKTLTLRQDLGRLVEAKTIVLWPRGSDYYARNTWAGRIKVDGSYIYDSPIHNAAAHFLQNMLYVSGPTPQESASIDRVYGENYRAKAIESADTQYLRVHTVTGCSLAIMATHACSADVHPVTEYLYEEGKIVWHYENNSETRVYRRKGKAYRCIEVMDNGDEILKDLAYLNMIDALRSGDAPLSTIHNSYQQVQCVEALFSTGIAAVDEGYTQIAPGYASYGKQHDHPITTIRDIESLMKRMFRENLSFYEAKVPWAVLGEEVPISAPVS